MKKLWLIPVGIAVVGLIAGGIYFFTNIRSSQTISPGGEQVKTVTPTPFQLATWTDEAGFSFQYPKDLVVNKHEEDPINYAHVALTNRDHPGGIIVWVSDLPPKVTDTASWVRNTASLSGAMTIDTTLGGEPAKKIRTATPAAMLIVAAVTDGLLFSVEGTLTDTDYWTRVHEAVVGSFAFTPEATTVTGGEASAEAVDEEEVIQ